MDLNGVNTTSEQFRNHYNKWLTCRTDRQKSQHSLFQRHCQVLVERAHRNPSLTTHISSHNLNISIEPNYHNFMLQYPKSKARENSIKKKFIGVYCRVGFPSRIKSGVVSRRSHSILDRLVNTQEALDTFSRKWIS